LAALDGVHLQASCPQHWHEGRQRNLGHPCCPRAGAGPGPRDKTRPVCEGQLQPTQSTATPMKGHPAWSKSQGWRGIGTLPAAGQTLKQVPLPGLHHPPLKELFPVSISTSSLKLHHFILLLCTSPSSLLPALDNPRQRFRASFSPDSGRASSLSLCWTRSSL